MSDIRNPAGIIYLGLVALAAVWLLGLAAAPWLLTNGHPLPAVILYRGFSVICHQIPERSYHYHSLPLAVCARCTGIYAGFLTGLLVAPLWRGVREIEPPPRWWLVVSVLPVLVDFSGDLIGLFVNSHLSRTVTGAIPGVVGAWFFLPVLVDFFSPEKVPDDRSGAADNKFHKYLAEGETE